MSDARHMTDNAFMAWCESSKKCASCQQFFVGPVCPCEWERIHKLDNQPGRRASRIRR